MHLSPEGTGQELVKQFNAKIPLGHVFHAALMQESGE